MKHILLLKVYFCAFALLSVSVSARTVSTEIDLHMDLGTTTLTFTFPSDTSIMMDSLGENAYYVYSDYYSGYSDSLDLFLMDEWALIPEAGSSTFALYTDSPGFWIPLDTASLDLSTTLNLKDTMLFQQRKQLYPESQNLFIFQTNKEVYAFCRTQFKDSLNLVFLFTVMYLTCEVQEDGTPTFDSIPQYSGSPDTVFVYKIPSWTWEDTVTIHLGKTEADGIAFSKYNAKFLHITPSSSDIYFAGSCAVDEGYPCIYEVELHGNSTNGSIWTVKDIIALDFTTTFDLSDNSVFHYQGTSVELDSGKYGFEQYFILLLGSGNYAFCHGTLVDTTFIWAWNGSLVSDYVRMPLACQVQEDGTPTFDSIPQYKEPPLALPPLRQNTIQKQEASFAPYRVNGTTAGTSTAIGIRVGKHTAIREQ